MTQFGIYFDGTIENPEISGEELHTGRIVLGRHEETVQGAAERWSADDYRRQWLEAIDVLEQSGRSALINSVAGTDSNDVIWWWPMYKFDQTVLVHNQMLFLNQLESGYQSMSGFLRTGSQCPNGQFSGCLLKPLDANCRPCLLAS